jgi:hypothetical protein
LPGARLVPNPLETVAKVDSRSQHPVFLQQFAPLLTGFVVE